MLLTPTAYNLMYRLRKKGIMIDTKQRVIFLPYFEKIEDYPQILRLSREFYFNVQYIIV
jgi:hypothetical protein